MLIDWFTVAAQVVNFLVLVWLLKRFLYKPVLDAVDAREKRIADMLADAEAKQTAAEGARQTYQRDIATFEQTRDALMSKAVDDANAQRQRLLDEARAAANAAADKRMEALRGEAAHLNEAIRRRTQQEVFAIARKTLADLATTSLEERLCDVFTRRLRALDAPTKARIAAALASATEPARVRSAFELSNEQRTTIHNALDETFSASIAVRFETASDLVGGIELTTQEYSVGWTISGYLAALEAHVVEPLNDAPGPGTDRNAQ